MPIFNHYCTVILCVNQHNTFFLLCLLFSILIMFCMFVPYMCMEVGVIQLRDCCFCLKALKIPKYVIKRPDSFAYSL